MLLIGQKLTQVWRVKSVLRIQIFPLNLLSCVQKALKNIQAKFHWDQMKHKHFIEFTNICPTITFSPFHTESDVSRDAIIALPQTLEPYWGIEIDKVLLRQCENIVASLDESLYVKRTCLSRNYVVWPIFFLINVFTALKGTHFFILFAFTAAGVVPCGCRKTSPRTSTIVQFIFYFWSFEISVNILRNQK